MFIDWVSIDWNLIVGIITLILVIINPYLQDFHIQRQLKRSRLVKNSLLKKICDKLIIGEEITHNEFDLLMHNKCLTDDELSKVYTPEEIKKFRTNFILEFHRVMKWKYKTV